MAQPPKPKAKIDRSTLIIYCIIGVFILIGCILMGGAMDCAVDITGHIDFTRLGTGFNYVASHPSFIFSRLTNKNSYVPKMLFVGGATIGLYALYKYSEEKKRLHRRGSEHGSAKWGDDKEIKQLADPTPPTMHPIKVYDALSPDGHRIYDEKGNFMGVMIDNNILFTKEVFLSLNGGNFSVYDYIRSELIAKGIPAEEIIFAPKSEAKNREDIFRDINAGKYRIVIASTSTLGTGANVQERLAAVHHVDIPWKPSDFEQREGRILRQGNSFSEVQIFNYITEGTMDSYLYQVVTDKARFIAQLLDDETPARVSEDCDDKVLTYGEMQAAAEGNDNFRKRIELGMKVSELQFAKAEFQRETGEIRKTVAAIPDQIASLRDRIGSIACDIETVDRMRNAEGKIEGLTIMTATGHTLTKQEDINQFLHGLLIQKQKAPFDEVPAFKIDAFQVTVEMDGSQQDFAFAVKGASPVAYRTAAEVHDKSNNAQRLLNLLNNSVANEKTKCENRIEKLNTDLIQATERLTIAFPYEQELQQAQSELEQVEAELLGITEMEAAILDPDEQPIEETPKEKNERESFGKIGDADDLNPNTSGEILPPRI